jgi:autoinducer 2-degrading protein
MSYTFLARFRVKPEHDAQFVELIDAMEANTKDEPKTLEYKFYRLDEAGGFAVFESFTDESGDQDHRDNPANAPIIERMIGCMEDGYEREFLLPVRKA